MTMAKKSNKIAILARLGYEVKEDWRIPVKRNKYGAKRVGEHASHKEHNRAAQLRMWQQAGLISDLREQVAFELIPSQYSDFQYMQEQCATCPEVFACWKKRGNALCGIAADSKPQRTLIERACRYIADFVYTDNETGQTVVEDTKGVRTKEYIIKRKLMLFVHGIRIREI